MSATTSPPAARELPAEPVVVARRRRSLPDIEALLARPWVTVLALAALTLISAAARYRAVAAALWLDEAQAVDIARHSIGQIPHLLQLDGSPPLYYVLLHAWMSVFGDSETHEHWLSIIFAALCVPAGWLAARVAAGPRAAWIAAVLLAFNSFLNGYADQARMYTLLSLLTLLTVAAFVAAYVHRRRAFVPAFSVALAASLYTHNWAFFVALGCVAGVVVCWLLNGRDRRLAVDAVLGFGLAGILYAPWIPQLLYQVQHTGAPWSTHPTTHQFMLALGDSVGSTAAAMLILLVGVAGVIPLVRGPRTTARTSVLAVGAIAVACFIVSYAFCKLTLAFAPRYFAIFVAPLTVLGAAGFSRMGKMGLAAMILVAALTFGEPAGSDLDKKTNVAVLSHYMSAHMHKGDIVVSMQPEQVPTLVRYMRPGLRYAIPYKVVNDPGVMDWRDVMSKMRAANVQQNLLPLIASLPRGGRLLMVDPVTDPNTKRKSKWYTLTRERKLQFLGALYANPCMRKVTKYSHHLDANIAVATAVLFEKTCRR